MRRNLAFIALAGFATSFVCLGAAFALGGGNLGDADFNFSGLDRPACDFALADKTASRAIAWNEAGKAAIAVPANVHYQRGQGDRLVVTGDSALVSHVVLKDDGTVEMDCRMSRMGGTRLDVTLPGRAFDAFALAGTGSVALNGLDQPDLKISLAGSGTVEASGKTDNLHLSMAGSGDAHLGALAAGHATLNLAGSSRVEVAARDDLNVHIAGSGTVTLRGEPHSLETHIAGSGHIIHATL